MSEVSTWNFSFDEAAKACCLSTEDLLAIEGKKVIGCAEWQRIGNRIQVGIGGGVWTIDTRLVESSLGSKFLRYSLRCTKCGDVFKRDLE